MSLNSLPTSERRPREQRPTPQQREVWSSLFWPLSWAIHAPGFWISQRRGRESSQAPFDSRAYVRLLFDSGLNVESAATARLLEYDFVTYLEEFACWVTKVHEYGQLGVAASYPKGLEELGQRFVKEQRRRGHRLSRAQVEQFAMQWLTAWMSDPAVPDGEILVWVSPRGLKTEGYLGLEDSWPVKVNFYQRVTESPTQDNDHQPKHRTVFQQFTVWTQDSQLRAMQNELLQQVGGQEEWILSQTNLNSRHQTIARFLRLNGSKVLVAAGQDGGQGDGDLSNSCENFRVGEESFLNIIEQILYKKDQEAMWPTSRAELLVSRPELRPVFDEVSRVFVESFSELVRKTLGPSFGEFTNFTSLSRDSRWPRLLRTLDQLFELHFGAVVAVVTELKKPNISAQAQAEVLQQQLGRVRASSLDLIEAFQTQAPLSESQSQNLLALTQALSLVTQQTASAAQCSILTPFSLAAKGAGRLSNLATPNFLGLRPDLARAVSKLGDQLTTQEILHQLDDLDYVELDLRGRGAHAVYMVPRSYLDGLGCAVLDNGQVVGPCPDETKLAQHQLTLAEFGQLSPAQQHQYCLSLSDPRDTMALEMDRDQFEALRQELINQIESELQDELAEFESELNDSTELSPQEKARALSIFRQLMTLVFRSSISVDEFLSGGSELSGEGLLKLPLELVEALRAARTFPDKLQLLGEWSSKLEPAHDEVLALADSSKLSDTPPSAQVLPLPINQSFATPTHITSQTPLAA